MTVFDAIDPEGARQRLRFESTAEADAAADQRREAGHNIYWIAWSKNLGRWVSIPED